MPRSPALMLLSMALMYCMPIGNAAELDAAERDAVVIAFYQYWNAYSGGQYRESADLMCSADLVGLRSGLLPIFKRLSTSKEADAKKLADVFFQGVAPTKRDELNEREVLVQMMNFVATLNPDMAHVIRNSRPTITELSVESGDKSLVTLQYKLSMQGAPEASFQQLRNTEDGWCLVPPESPADITARLKRLFKM